MMAKANLYVNLAKGMKMPLLGLGTWKSEPSKLSAAVKAAIDTGYRHIDCAYCYENEETVGDGIQAKTTDGTVKREDLFITSKLFESFHRLGDVESGLKKSLQSLKLDYLDLYLVHWPFGIQGMEQLVQKGLVKSIGVSNFNISQIKEIQALPNKVPISNNQIELSPYLVQDDLVSFCKSQGITVTAYSPLGSPDRKDPQDDDPILMDDPKLIDLARKKGKSVAQILIQYHLQQNVACMPKSVTPSRILENFQSLHFTLTDSEVEELKSLNRNNRYCTYDEAFGHPLHPFDPTH
ncbi:aldose reductase-related protein 2-like isoform X3 [Apostichopus japonicus]|uniref:aldose reductase-related protein 2-like isoform X3 n=1 Tax=Stichopus japonicus TaxID=307972 RepID=UPI003AB8AAFD